MSLECSECERDLRGGHDPSCSRYIKPCTKCEAEECDEECNCECHTKVPRRAGRRREGEMVRLGDFSLGWTQWYPFTHYLGKEKLFEGKRRDLILQHHGKTYLHRVLTSQRQAKEQGERD